MATDTDYNLYIDNVKMPPPAKEGISEADQLIWSSNAGRTANATLLCDIIATKKTLTINWNQMTYDQLALIRSNISRIGHPFIVVRYISSNGAEKTFTGYTEGSTSIIVTYTPTGKIAGVTVNIIEK